MQHILRHFDIETGFSGTYLCMDKNINPEIQGQQALC